MSSRPVHFAKRGVTAFTTVIASAARQSEAAVGVLLCGVPPLPRLLRRGLRAMTVG